MSEPKKSEILSDDESVLGIQNPKATSSGPNNNFVKSPERSVREQVFADLDLIFQRAALNGNNDLNAAKPSGNLSYSYHLGDSCFYRSFSNDSVYLGKSLLKIEKTMLIAEKHHKLDLRKAVHGNIAVGHFVIKNVGKQTAFLKILPFYDLNFLNGISADIVRVSPQACVIHEKESQDIFLFVKNLPEEYVLSKPFGCLGIFSDTFEDVFYSSVQLFVKEFDVNMDPEGLNVGFCEALSPNSL